MTKDDLSDRMKAELDKTVEMLREKIATPMKMPQIVDTPVDIRAECEKHGSVRAINRNGQAYCETCLRLCDAGRFLEVFEQREGGTITTPTLTLYPDAPINFISITATIAKGDTDGQ